MRECRLSFDDDQQPEFIPFHVLEALAGVHNHWTDYDDGFYLVDDGTLDTVIALPGGLVARYSQECAAEYRDVDTGSIDLARFIDDVVWPEFESGAFDPADDI